MKYVGLPAITLALSIILAMFMAGKLAPQVAYHFSNNMADRYMARGAFLGWIIVPHVFFLIAAIAVIRMVMFWAKYVPPGETPLSELLLVMGNIFGLPPVIWFAVTLQLAITNAFKTSLFPLWILPTAILIIGAVIIVIVFIRVWKKYRNKKLKAIRS